MIYDDNDIHSAALCAWKEARGEGVTGMQAVLCVLKNRVGFTGFRHDLHDVIYGKNQFTSMSVPSDPEFNLEPVANDELFGTAMSLAKGVFDGSLGDITKGAHYYANLHTASSGWFYDHIVLNTRDHPITEQLGKHTFFY